jgi:hypothetical protein
MNGFYLKQAAELWANGKPLEAGRLVYENLPVEERPKWAARILKLILGKSGIQSSQLDKLLDIANNKHLWKEGHSVFDSIRDSTLQLDELRRTRKLSVDETLQNSVLSFAELVAKVVYNATNPPDEFDEDSGWWIAACLRGFVDNRWTDEAFEKEAWESLSSS